MTQIPSEAALPQDIALKRRVIIGFLNMAHALDHFVVLIFPTVVIGLEAVYGRSYDELIALGTASFVAFGVFSIPAGWLADRWSRRNMIAVFYVGCGLSQAAAAFAPNLTLLAGALFLLGMFAAIYHPVGTAMLLDVAEVRGRTLAFNGVCGNMGAAVAAGITAALASWLGWRGAFLVPAAICILAGIAYLWFVPDDRRRRESRSTHADVPLTARTMATVFGLFVVVALASGLVFNVASVAVPKIVDERVGADIPLWMVGGLATAIFMCGALAQLTVGRLVERFRLHVLFATIAVLQFASIALATYATGLTLLVVLAVALAAIYGQVTINDLVVARYTADAWRGRIYAVRYFLTFASSGVAVAAIAALYARGGFDLVLGTTTLVALVFVIAALVFTFVISGIERARLRAVAAE